MIDSDFQQVKGEILDHCNKILGTKADEYATKTDLLRNFKQIANLESKSWAEAVTGLMSKPITSLYDWVGEGQIRTLDEWDEKIADSINYLILLRAVIIEAMADGVPELPTDDFNESRASRRASA